MKKRTRNSHDPDQLGLLHTEKTLETLPTAKVKLADKAGVHGWTNFYAAFSESFVNHALGALNLSETDLLLDPFVGSGTTLVSALKMGVNTIGIDLDPFSCLLSRAKVATKVDEAHVKAILKRTNRHTPNPDFGSNALDLFDSDCLSYASTVFDRVRKRTGTNSTTVLQRLLHDRRGKYDSEVVAVTALCIGASNSANLVRGSNPTWYRKGVTKEKDNIQALYSSTKAIADSVVRDLETLSSVSRQRRISIYNQDVTVALPNFGSQEVSHIVTSPPYLTRMDYVVKHLPHLLMLAGLAEIDLELLRNRMIGTPRIVSKGDIDERWGAICRRCLNLIKEHSSYASAGYYVWTYYQYFESLHLSLTNINSTLKIGGIGVLVVQDSYYKDIHIPLSDIVIEMLDLMGVTARVVRHDEVASSLKQINPAYKKNANKPTEDAIYFEKR